MRRFLGLSLGPGLGDGEEGAGLDLFAQFLYNEAILRFELRAQNGGRGGAKEAGSDLFAQFLNNGGGEGLPWD